MQSAFHFFQNRRLVIVTMHEKEKVIAPLAERYLGVYTMVGSDINTDLFGTFSGETERQLDIMTTLRNKCLQGMEKYGCDLAVASEGSFGMHPLIFNVPVDDESLLLMDKKHQLEIHASIRSMETNFGGKEICDVEELESFATISGFPSHALIIRRDKGTTDHIFKGIRDWKTLYSTFDELHQRFGKVYVETDMRAMYNPGRMKVIEDATNQLISKVLSCCPQCHMPGFSLTGTDSGLPCELCKAPTKSVKYEIYTCQSCLFMEIKPYPKGKMYEDPMFCDYCNP